MYPHDKSCEYTSHARSVACGPLHTPDLSVELRAAPRDPSFSEISARKMATQKSREVTKSESLRLPSSAFR